MKLSLRQSASLLLGILCLPTIAQTYKVQSPDGHIALEVNNAETLTYAVTLDGKQLVATSPMGFQFRNENDMCGNFQVKNDAQVKSGVESWTPVVRNKHAQCEVPYNELSLLLQEKSDKFRRMDLTFRVMNDGVAFRYSLYGTPQIGNRQVLQELTGYAIPEGSSLWVPQYGYSEKGKGYSSSQEGPFIKTPVKDIKSDIHAGLPGLIEVDKENYMAILEANLDNFPAFYLGSTTQSKDGFLMLNTKLTPILGEDESGVKARFSEKVDTPWRIIMAGHNPGKFLESEISRSLNPDCVLEDVSWIKPGMSSWDNWWSGDLKMEPEVIRQYIDLAAKEGWPYMLIDWTWYGPYNVPSSDITKPLDKLDMPALIKYANDRNVDIWLWLRSEDTNHNDQYKKAFPLYRQWGVKGVKIDFMDRDDQDMVNWYRRIIKATAENHLMLDFHGAYSPDGIDRTYPHLLTREGVLANEYNKHSRRVTPEHNVTLAYTRLLAGPMDYTPGGFLNVTPKEFKPQRPTLVMNTRAAELAKFVIYESPYIVFADHPDNVYGQVGEDFVQVVPTTWDDIRFISGTPETYVALAKKSGNKWFIGILNNSEERTVSIDLSPFTNGSATLEYWQDGKKANVDAKACDHKTTKLKAGKPLTVKMASGGGFVGILSL